MLGELIGRLLLSLRALLIHADYLNSHGEPYLDSVSNYLRKNSEPYYSFFSLFNSKLS
jgi:hypothetical protein